MKLIIQIPCYNEEKTLPLVFRDLPKKIKGINKIETQVIDDGSSDKTIQVAKRLKVNYLIRFKQNRGLAAAFKAGINNALANKADILVNTDGDNQYFGKDIAKLVEPILKNKADVVVGCRPINKHPEFSFLKKRLQQFGSFLLSKIVGTKVKDASSGFRAYNREAMLHVNIFTKFSYCMETLIQASYNNLTIVTQNIRVNLKTRESRLFKNMGEYLIKSTTSILYILLLYRSQQVFTAISVTFLLTAIVLIIRFLLRIMLLGSTAATFWPTVVFAGVLLAISFQLYLTGLISSLISSNRKLLEEINFRLKEINKKTKKYGKKAN